jgi:prevent-host-death family protein
MPASKPETTTMNVTEARAQFSSLLNSVFRGEQRVIVEKNGIPVAALVSIDDLKSLERFDAETAYRRRIVTAIREPFKDIPSEEIEAEVARIIEEDRAEQRAARLAQRAT